MDSAESNKNNTVSTAGEGRGVVDEPLVGIWGTGPDGKRQIFFFPATVPGEDGHPKLKKSEDSEEATEEDPEDLLEQTLKLAEEGMELEKKLKKLELLKKAKARDALDALKAPHQMRTLKKLLLSKELGELNEDELLIGVPH